jgi:hypothetical protein
MLRHPGCRLQRRSSANISTTWSGRVAQAPRERVARALRWSCSSPCWRPSVVENRTVRGYQLGLDDEANSQIADRGATGSRLPGEVTPRSAICQLVFQRQRGPADPRESVLSVCADAPRISYNASASARHTHTQRGRGGLGTGLSPSERGCGRARVRPYGSATAGPGAPGPPWAPRLNARRPDGLPHVGRRNRSSCRARAEGEIANAVSNA